MWISYKKRLIKKCPDEITGTNCRYITNKAQLNELVFYSIHFNILYKEKTPGKSPGLVVLWNGDMIVIKLCNCNADYLLTTIYFLSTKTREFFLFKRKLRRKHAEPISTKLHIEQTNIAQIWIGPTTQKRSNKICNMKKLADQII